MDKLNVLRKATNKYSPLITFIDIRKNVYPFPLQPLEVMDESKQQFCNNYISTCQTLGGKETLESRLEIFLMDTGAIHTGAGKYTTISNILRNYLFYFFFYLDQQKATIYNLKWINKV